MFSSKLFSIWTDKSPQSKRLFNLNRNTMKSLIITFLLTLSLSVWAQYAPNAETMGTTAIHMDSSIIVSWATEYQNYYIGTDVDETWQTPEKALGHAIGTSGDVVSLGRGGSITFSFDTLIVNGDGPDFVTFENSFSNEFLELGWVEVSMDGQNFVRFPNYSNTSSSVDGFGVLDATKIHGYCSKYKQGYGTPFDLDSIGIDTIQYIRIIDIIGNGTAHDTEGNVIYDPYPTSGSTGVDIEAIGVIHAGSLFESIDEVTAEAFRIYPNPAKDYFKIASEFKVETCRILDYTGKLVKTFPKNQELYSTSDLKEGLYLLQILSGEASVNQTLIIQ